MNKQHLREAAHNAMQQSDEWDAQRLAAGQYPALNRDWARLNSFFIAFCSDLTAIDHELANELDAFATRVLKGENPLLDAAPGSQEKSA